MPKEALKLYTEDDSGCNKEPRPGCSTKPANRIDYITHQALNRFLSGPGLNPLFDRFTESLIHRLQYLELKDEWKCREDLWSFYKDNVTPAALEAMCGSSLMSLAPSFSRDLWAYDAGIPDLVKGLPRWLAPRSYAKRDHILDKIKKWHAYARKHYKESSIAPDGDWDPHFGSEFIRSRQKTFPAMDGMDDNAMAASDLGAIWA